MNRSDLLRVRLLLIFFVALAARGLTALRN